MKEVHLITVGKLKDDRLESIEKDYLKRFDLIDFKISEVRPLKENKNLESSEVLKKIGDVSKDRPSFIILLAEKGKSFKSSVEFANWFGNLLETRSEKIIFVIGGAAGHGEDLIKKADQGISLSPLTFPHKLARVLFIEQLYRAQSINKGHPYHK